jgi:glucosamine--fructose-6-phosphate aminotransferase (isomerizing)
MVVVAPQGIVLPNVLDLISKLSERGAELLIISNDDTALKMSIQQMPLPVVPEWVSPILAVIPGQVFAMQQALVRGYAVDKPRGLSKVTVTQ